MLNADGVVLDLGDAVVISEKESQGQAGTKGSPLPSPCL